MPRVRILHLLPVLMAACSPAVAPAPAPIPEPVARTATAEDTGRWRPFFDSLAAGITTARPAPLTLAGDTATAVAWLDLLQDPVLADLVREGLANNRDLATARARIREFRAEVGVERADLLPQLVLNGSVATEQSVFGSLGTFGFDSWRVTADLNWELDFWGRLRGNVAGARADLGARGEDVRATVLSLVSDITAAYLQLRALDANRAIAERTLTSRQSTLQLAERRLDEGVISELDVRLFEAQVAQPAARVAEFTLAIARQEHLLSQLVGRAPGRIARGAPLSQVARSVALPDSVAAVLIERRPDVMRAGYELTAAAARAGSARKDRLPRFFVSGVYGTQAEEAGNLFQGDTEVYQLRAGVSVGLFEGGRQRSRIEAASAREEQARYRYEQAVLTALREVSDAIVAVQATRDQLAAQDVQLRALRRAFELAERRYDNGVSSYLEVLDAQRSLFEAELATTSAEQAHLASAVQLYRALGGSWEPQTLDVRR